MQTREVLVLSWCADNRKPQELSLGLINNTQTYQGNVAVGATLEIDEVLEEHSQTISILGRVALREPEYKNSKLDANFHLSKQESAAGFGVIRYSQYNELLSRLDYLERLVENSED